MTDAVGRLQQRAPLLRRDDEKRRLSGVREIYREVRDREFFYYFPERRRISGRYPGGTGERSRESAHAWAYSSPEDAVTGLAPAIVLQRCKKGKRPVIAGSNHFLSKKSGRPGRNRTYIVGTGNRCPIH